MNDPRADKGWLRYLEHPDFRQKYTFAKQFQLQWLEGPILPTLLRLAAPNVLNLLALAGVITFDGFYLGRIGTNALAAGAWCALPWTA